MWGNFCSGRWGRGGTAALDVRETLFDVAQGRGVLFELGTFAGRSAPREPAEVRAHAVEQALIGLALVQKLLFSSAQRRTEQLCVDARRVDPFRHGRAAA